MVYNREWLEYLRALQPDDEAAEWIAAIAAGLFNRGNEFIPILDLDQLEVEPRAEGISSGGNVVKVLEIRSGSARIEMLYVGDDPPDLHDINYQDSPWLVTKFTSVSVEGEVGNAGGIDVYFPNLANRICGYWVDMQRVELFPQLSYSATVVRSISRFDTPATTARVIGGLAAGQMVTIREYLPQGSDVWGRTDSGWILLLYQIQGQPIYTTSWSMETRPPISIP